MGGSGVTIRSSARRAPSGRTGEAARACPHRAACHRAASVPCSDGLGATAKFVLDIVVSSAGRAWKGVTSPGLPRIARTAAVSAARRRLLAADERGVIAGSSQMTVQRGASATVVAWPDQAGVTSTGESCRVGQKARLPWLWAISTRLVGTRRGGLGISGTYPASPFTKRRGRAPRRCRRRSMRRWVTPIAGATDVRCSKTTP